MNILLILCLSIFFIIQVVVILHYYKVHKRLNQLRDMYAEMNDDLDALQGESKALLSADITFGRALHQLKKSFHTLESDLLTFKNQHPHDTAYQQSMKMLNIGGDPAALEDSHLLSKAETELIKNLHEYRSKLKKGHDKSESQPV